MLSENIKNLRKQKGYSQETLAQELNVVRQTVSKWEKGYSVPDAVMLEQIAELFEVSVGELLGSDEKTADYKSELEKITAQLAILNDQYAREMARKQRIREIKMKIFIPVLAVFLGCVGAILALCLVSRPVDVSYQRGDISSTVIISDIASEMYTPEEIASATDAAMNYFCHEFGGCRLDEIYYGGDELSKQEGEYYDEDTLVLLSEFYVGSVGKDSPLDGGSTYKDWKWIMTRNDDGEWMVANYGFC